MIDEITNEHGRSSVRSDRWHVIHARWERNLTEQAVFARSVVSEHDDRAAAELAARILVQRMVSELAERPLSLRDQIRVRPPGYRSYKRAHRLVSKRS